MFRWLRRRPDVRCSYCRKVMQPWELNDDCPVAPRSSWFGTHEVGPEEKESTLSDV